MVMMPCLSHCFEHAPVNWPVTGSANFSFRLVITLSAHKLSSVFLGVRSELPLTMRAVEMIRVIRIALIPQLHIFLYKLYRLPTCLADIAITSTLQNLLMALATDYLESLSIQAVISKWHERLCRGFLALVAIETFFVPVMIHRLNEFAFYEFAASVALRCIQYLEVVWAVAFSVVFIKFIIWKGLKALSADKTLSVKELASTLDDTVFPPQSLATGRTALVVKLHFFVVFSRCYL